MNDENKLMGDGILEAEFQNLEAINFFFFFYLMDYGPVSISNNAKPFLNWSLQIGCLKYKDE